MQGRRKQPRWAARVRDGARELGRTPVRFAVRLAVARLITQWRSLLTVIAGTILAASIGALIPLYTTAVAQVGMTQRLDDEPAQDAHLAASISLRASQWADRGGLRQIAADATALVMDRVRDDLGAIKRWVDEVVVYEETEAMGFSLLAADGASPVPLIGARARLAHYDGWQDRARIVAGRLPQDPPEAVAGVPVDMEIAIGLNVANELNLGAGAVIVLDQGMNQRGETGGGHPTSRPITARIVGVVAPNDEREAYWMEPSPLRLLDRQSGAGLWEYEFVFLTTEDAAYRAAIDFLPDTPTRIGWRVLFAHDNLPFSTVGEDPTNPAKGTARYALRVFERNMRDTFVQTPLAGSIERQDLGYNYHTRLIEFDAIRQDRDSGILLDYARRQQLLDAPFGLLLLQVGALVLFFLMVTAALVRRSERREIAMLQSRGAWDGQIMLLRGIEALLIGALATLAAPLLARLLLTWLGPAVANTQDFPLPLTPDVFLYAGLAAAVTFLALMGALRPALRLPLALAGGAAARSADRHWWQRYYLDAMLAVVGLGGLALLVRRGTPLADVNLGGQQADPLMLLAPALLFLALGSLALRFFPIIATGAARVAAASRGLIHALAGWQLSREPAHYGRITFLLALAIGTGWFATSFRATVTNSHDDQAEYRVGTDLRFIERDTQLNANRARPAGYYLAQDHVVAASVAFRVPNHNLSVNVMGNLRGTILAVDPDTLGETRYWRSDLGPVRMPRNPGDPPDLPERGVTLPFAPARVGLWARFDRTGVAFRSSDVVQANVNRLVERTDLNLRFLDAAGAWIVVPVEPVEIEYNRVGQDRPGLGAGAFVASGWVYMEADLAALEYEAQGPVRLVSAFWTYLSVDPRGERGDRLTLADLTLIDAEEIATPFRLFSGAGNTWDFLYDHGAGATGGAAPGWRIAGERSDALYVTWSQDAQRTTVGVVLNYPDLGPVDAVVSRRMAQENGLLWGANAAPFRILDVGGSNLAFRAIQVADYFPSLYDAAPNAADARGDSFMVMDARDLLYRLNRRPGATFYPDEVWLRFDTGFDKRDPAAVETFLRRLDRADAGGVVLLNEVSLAGELGKLRSDPLSLGLLGLMYLAFLIALALSVVGLLTYASLTAQARRSEFAVLRALGLPARRVVGGLALEQAFVMGIAALLGAVLGWALASQVVPTLALGAAGEGITPPFVMRVETRRVIDYAAMMGAVLALALGSSLLLVRRMSLARTLRLGDE
jgi:hypothetical protein